MNPAKDDADSYKNPSLRRWRVIEVVSLNGSRTRHVHGHDVTHDTGRASSAIKEFDRDSMTAITHSGRTYKLLGAPGHARSGESAWEKWCRKSGVVSKTDVTSEYFTIDKLFDRVSPIIELTQYIRRPFKGKERTLKHMLLNDQQQTKPAYPGLNFNALSGRCRVIGKGFVNAIKNNFQTASTSLRHSSGIPFMAARTDGQPPCKGERPMTYRYSKRLAYLQFAAAWVMLLALYINTEPKLWGWLLFMPLFFFVILQGVRTYRYSLTVDTDNIILDDIERAQYPVAEIAAINVWPAKGDRIAVITFTDRRKLSFPGHLEGFDNLVESLRKQKQLDFEIRN